ncbi:MAG: phospholipase D family protein [Alphaproteobacteria bacterium]|nr:phospholipase D family protein [Alphaproteobacteria bacterium]
MLIVQNRTNPAAVRHAIVDALRSETARLLITSAYVSLGGSNIFRACCSQRISGAQFAFLPKAIVTSFDFGITEPGAIRLWRETPNTEVRVAGADRLRAGSLIPERAFHPKMYLFLTPAARAAGVIGSANLTSRGLITNTEAVWLQHDLSAEAALAAWNATTEDTVLIDDELLQRYEEIRRRTPPTPEQIEVEPLPEPAGPVRQALLAFPEAITRGDLRPEDFDQMWVEVERLQGGSRNQLELPRGAHRFFHFQFDQYDSGNVERIGEPILIAGGRQWSDRPLTWHGDNGMERINLPTQLQGGFDYRNSLILFRRINNQTFELAVAAMDSDLARAWEQSSLDTRLIYRLGHQTNRMVGFI